MRDSIKRIIRNIGLLVVAFAVAITATVSMPIKAEAATMLDKKTIRVGLYEDVNFSLKSKYAMNNYINGISTVSGDAEVLSSTYGMSPDSRSVKFTAAKKGTVTIGVNVTNVKTKKTKVCKVKIIVSDKVKKKADFDVVDTKGKEKNIKKYFGKPMVINFWATWCGPCMNEMPEMKKAYDSYKKKVSFMFVNVWDKSTSEVSSAKKYLENAVGGSMPVYVESGDKSSTNVQYDGIPCTIFVNKKGKIVHKQVGSYQSYSDLEQDIKKYLL